MSKIILNMHDQLPNVSMEARDPSYGLRTFSFEPSSKYMLFMCQVTKVLRILSICTVESEPSLIGCAISTKLNNWTKYM